MYMYVWMLNGNGRCYYILCVENWLMAIGNLSRGGKFMQCPNLIVVLVSLTATHPRF